MSDVGRSDRDDVLARLIDHLESDPSFDVDRFLDRYPEQRQDLRTRLENLRRAGLVRPGSAKDSAAKRVRRHFGMSDEPRGDAGSIEPRELPSRRLGRRFEVRDELGRGGMGRVLRARDVDLDREVAIKVVGGAEAEHGRELLERFVVEAQITGELEHPNIVPVHELSIDERGRPFYAMKLVEGRTLDAVIRDLAAGEVEVVREFTLARCIEIVQRICDALAFAHSRGVVHRDLKPANVMVGRFGEVQVVDWGLAKRRRQREASSADARSSPESYSRIGDVFGTPTHMAPEQARGEIDAIDERTDVFGIGAILHHLLTGRPPYAGVDAGAVRLAARERALQDPGFRHSRSRVPRELRAICLKAMATEKGERYASVRELSADLSAFLERRAGLAWSDRPFARAAKWTSRHPVAATALLAALALAATLSSAVSQRQVAAAEREERARLETARERSDRRDRVERMAHALERARISAPSHQATGERENHPEIVAAYSRALAAASFSLADRASADALVAELRDETITSPRARRTIVDALYQCGVSMFMADYAHAAELAQGRIAPSAEIPSADELRALYQRERDRCDAWTWLCAVVGRVDDDDECRSAWERFVGYVRDGDITQMQRLLSQSTTPSSSVPTRVLVLSIASRLAPTAVVLPHWRRLADDRPELFEPHAQICYASHLVPIVPPEVAREGIIHGEAARAITPDALWIHVNLGLCYHDDGQREPAIRATRRAVELAPREPIAWLNLGYVVASAWSSTDELREALDAYARSIELGTRDESAFINLHFLQKSIGDVAGALATIEAGLRALPDRPRLAQQAFATYGSAGELERAFDVLGAAVVDDSAWTLGLCELGGHLAFWGQIENALKYLEAGACWSGDFDSSPVPYDPREQLRDARRMIALITGAQTSTDAFERHVLALKHGRRDEHFQALKIYRGLIAELEAQRDADAWFERASLPAWVTYRWAAGTAVAVAEGRGALIEPRVGVDWRPDLALAPIDPALGLDRFVAPEERAKLAGSPLDSPEARELARSQALAWLRSAVEIVFADAKRETPVLSTDDRTSFASGLAAEAQFQSLLDERAPVRRFATLREALAALAAGAIE